jgi:hypothetical protein
MGAVTVESASAGSPLARPAGVTARAAPAWSATGRGGPGAPVHRRVPTERERDDPLGQPGARDALDGLVVARVATALGELAAQRIPASGCDSSIPRGSPRSSSSRRRTCCLTTCAPSSGPSDEPQARHMPLTLTIHAHSADATRSAWVRARGRPRARPPVGRGLPPDVRAGPRHGSPVRLRPSDPAASGVRLTAVPSAARQHVDGRRRRA